VAFPATAVRFPGAARRVNGDGAVRPATSRSRRHGIRDITAGRRACTRPTRTGRRQLPVARKVKAHPSLILLLILTDICCLGRFAARSGGLALAWRDVSRRLIFVAPRLPSDASAYTTPAALAAHGWRHSTCTRVWPGGSYAIARSPSRGRSTPWFLTRRHWPRSSGSAMP
jgi:hypothetical protein